MDTAAARKALQDQRQSLESALSLMERYEREGDNWKNDFKSSQKSTILDSARAGGVDLSTWDG